MKCLAREQKDTFDPVQIYEGATAPVAPVKSAPMDS